MAIDFLLDSTGDIDITNNCMTLTPNVETSSRQQVLITLRTYLGEWAYNIAFGIPYLENDNNPTQILGAGSNKNLIDLTIKDAILTRENIIRIISYSSSLDRRSREITISFTAETNTGEIISVENEPLT